MYLFFDTETTGLPDFKHPGDLKSQPHIVQLAALLTDNDGRERGSFKALIKPDGWAISKEAAAVHGISTDDCHAFGVPIRHAIALFSKFLDRAEMVVAHNVRFDTLLVHIEGQRLARDRLVFEREQFCTMDTAAPIVNLPPTDRMLAAGINRPKSPRLEECVRFFFEEELEDAHDAMADVRACARVFFELRRRQSEAKTAATA